ncbi:MAG: hypothetical protein ACE5K1_04805 [Acidiferrobacterales bacterium]
MTVDIVTDLIALFTAIAVTYTAARVWLFATARPSISPSLSQNNRRNEAFQMALLAVSETTDIGAKLSRVRAALEAAGAMRKVQPTKPEVLAQIDELEEMHTALSNEALQLEIGSLMAVLRADALAGESENSGQRMLDLLTEAEDKGSADPRLVAHYATSIQECLNALEHASAVQQMSDNGTDMEHLSETIAAHLDVLEAALNDIPDGVRLYQSDEGFSTEICGQLEFDIVFELNGFEVDPEELDHELGQSVLQSIEASIKRRAATTRCPEHGTAARIIVSGDSLGNLSWETPGCCTELRDAIKKVLAPPR